jgi:hypothetical protein
MNGATSIKLKDEYIGSGLGAVKQMDGWDLIEPFFVFLWSNLTLRFFSGLKKKKWMQNIKKLETFVSLHFLSILRYQTERKKDSYFITLDPGKQKSFDARVFFFFFLSKAKRELDYNICF